MGGCSEQHKNCPQNKQEQAKQWGTMGEQHKSCPQSKQREAEQRNDNRQVWRVIRVWRVITEECGER